MGAAMNSIQGLVTVYGLKILAAIVIFFVGRILVKLIRHLICRLMERGKTEATLIRFTGNIVYAIGMVFIVLAALDQLGIQTTSFIAIIGAAGLAVGLALQGSLANFAAGVLMIIFRPIKVGDFVEAAGAQGVVDDLGIFTTTLKSPDNKMIIVPNSSVTGNKIVNFTVEERRRVDLVFGVGYGDDLQKVKAVLEEVLRDDERILKDPAPTVGVLELADSSVNFAVRPWVKTADYWGVFFDLNEKVKCRFDAEKISIPFPQRDVHMIQ
jgi:small conductance mechanosensitive channel